MKIKNLVIKEKILKLHLKELKGNITSYEKNSDAVNPLIHLLLHMLIMKEVFKIF